MTRSPQCRHCAAPVSLVFADLGTAPPSNSYLPPDGLAAPETYYPLKVGVCERCWLVQTEDFAGRETFFAADYAYFSSVSRSWLAHAEAYVADMAARFALGPSSHIVEIASNDGYLLQYAKAAGIPCTGIEPTHSTAEAARAKGIDVIEAFFGEAMGAQLAREGRAADLTAANNVLAHVPDINDFVRGFARVLKADGVATFEFPHLMRLVEGRQFDTIYHEHYSYLSLLAVHRVFTANGLAVFDVTELPTHGGSLRVFAQRADRGTRPVSPHVAELLARERAAGMETAEYYSGFQHEIHRIRDEALRYLIDARRRGLSVAAYGAAAKGNTLLNFCGVKSGLIDYVCDAAPSKAGTFLPGTRIPVVTPDRIDETRPDRILILPWNLRAEIAAQLAHVSQWGARFVVVVPQIEEFDPAGGAP